MTDTYTSQYYRCPDRYLKFDVMEMPSSAKGFFRFGENVIGYGRLSRCEPLPNINGALPNTLKLVKTSEADITYLPFDTKEIIDNLRHERYITESALPPRFLRKIYYDLLRPVIPNSLRRRLQKQWIMHRGKPKFPGWPVDHTADSLFQQLLLLALQHLGVKRIPFIWFWPSGATSAAIMTHDVETTVGRDLCPAIMEVDEAHGIKASFSIVPEDRYEVFPEFIDSIKKRGFEIMVQDLNHDGNLFHNREEYLQRIKKINAYGALYGATGFRSAVLYRNQAWFDQLKFSYDSSVPSSGYLEPQHGGCCTVMPYFVGNVLELPVTTTQDYALFNYLNSYDITLWKHQADLIMQQHGLINFIVHPDYITKPLEWGIYKNLVKHLRYLADEKGLWIATPGEIDLWWRQRSNMQLLETLDGIRIHGEGCERARIAYASEDNGKLMYTIQE